MARTVPKLEKLADRFFRQMLAAELVDRKMVEELQRLGYSWSIEEGCWTHADGSQVWEDE